MKSGSQIKKKVIIIGGGTAGIVIANHLQNHFEVTVIEKSKFNSYPLLYKVPLMIGILFRRKNSKEILKTEFELANGRKIPFYQSNILGGASVMNGAVHVFGFESKWLPILKRFNLSLNDLRSSNEEIYIENKNSKNKITVKEAPLNFIDEAFLETLGTKGIPKDNMSITEREACGPIFNTVKTFIRTSVMSLIQKKKFKVILNESVEKILFDDSGKTVGVKTKESVYQSDSVVLSAGVMGTCFLLLSQIKEDTNSPLKGLRIGDEIQDHTNLRVNVFSTKPLNSLNEVYASHWKKLLLGIKHFLGFPTVMRGTGATSAAYLDLDKDGSIDTRIQILQFSEAGRHGSKGSIFNTSEPSFSISINAIHPESKGTISFKNGFLKVDPNFLSSRQDIKLLKLALQYCIELLQSDPIKEYVKEIDLLNEMKNNPEKYIQDTMYSGHHLIGGAQHSITSDFEVKNTKGLFVCDASIFDGFVASNIHSSVVLLADMFAKKFIKKYS
jgi:choline dehydrogenase-like flavoprotein